MAYWILSSNSVCTKDYCNERYVLLKNQRDTVLTWRWQSGIRWKIEALNSTSITGIVLKAPWWSWNFIQSAIILGHFNSPTSTQCWSSTNLKISPMTSFRGIHPHVLSCIRTTNYRSSNATSNRESVGQAISYGITYSEVKRFRTGSLEQITI